jgi:nucleoside-diphosphate-sugar epimerase
MIHWITENLGTSSWGQVTPAQDIHLIDVRDLVDKAGNTPKAIKVIIYEALKWLQQNEKVVICCDYGISRSNAIAVGILLIKDNIAFDDATRRVMSATLQSGIRIETLNSVREAVKLFRPELSVLSEKSAIKILLTGASGCLGRPMARILADDFALEAPIRGEIDLLEGPINLDIRVREQNITHILHVANPRGFGRNLAQSMGQAVVMLKNILDVCKENHIKLLNISSWEVYSGYRSDRLLAPETLPPYPKGAMGETKLLCETIIQHYQSLYGIDYANLRAPIIYGSEDNHPKFLFNFLQKAARSEKITVHKYINGYPILDLMHVNDFCKAVKVILEKNASGTFNIGSGDNYSSKNIAEIICLSMDSKSPIKFINIDDYFANIVFDPQKIFALGWKPEINLHSGIDNLVAMFGAKKA